MTSRIALKISYSLQWHMDDFVVLITNFNNRSLDLLVELLVGGEWRGSRVSSTWSTTNLIYQDPYSVDSYIPSYSLACRA